MNPRPWPLLAGIVTWVMLLALTPVLLACAEGNKLAEGEVVEKGYDDPDTWTETSTYCMFRYQNGRCAAYGYDSYERHDGPHWSLKVTGLDEDGKERTETHEVTETLYELAQVGQVVNFPEAKVVPR